MLTSSASFVLDVPTKVTEHRDAATAADDIARVSDLAGGSDPHRIKSISTVSRGCASA